MALEQPLILIRERHQIDLFDLALVVIRRRPIPLAWATIVGVGPFVVLNTKLFSLAGSASPALSLIVWSFESPLALAPLTIVLGGMMFGRTPRPREVVRQLARSFLPLLWTHGFYRFVPLCWIPPRLLFANEILLLEHGGWTKLWSRGRSLVLGREGDLLLLSMGQFLAIWAIAFVTYFGLGRMSQAVVAEELTWDLLDSADLTGLRLQIPLWIGAAYFTVVRFLTYIDQRIRLEGWEVELRLRAAGQSLAEARRWS